LEPEPVVIVRIAHKVTTRPAISATNDSDSAPVTRSAWTMYCSVWRLTAIVRKAATVTSVIASMSAGVSRRIIASDCISGLALSQIAGVMDDLFRDYTCVGRNGIPCPHSTPMLCF
jgi:hypothetical protein